MPELPEVESIKISLEKLIINNTIWDVQVKTKKIRYELEENLLQHAIGGQIILLRRKGKYLILDLSNDYSLVVHLGMSGRFFVRPINSQLQKHDHVVLNLSDAKQIVFNDTRKFGMIYLLKSNMLSSHKIFSKQGIEPLSDKFTINYFIELLQNKHRAIKNILMDNNLILGIGNIYANESLFLAKINPQRHGATLKTKEIEALFHAINNVLSDAIKSGGTTLKDFVNGDNKPGYFSQKLKIYGKVGQNCSDCDNIIITIKQSGRSSFYCPVCQKN